MDIYFLAALGVLVTHGYAHITYENGTVKKYDGWFDLIGFIIVMFAVWLASQ